MQNYLFLFGALILGFILAAILGKLLIPVLKKAHLANMLDKKGQNHIIRNKVRRPLGA